MDCFLPSDAIVFRLGKDTQQGGAGGWSVSQWVRHGVVSDPGGFNHMIGKSPVGISRMSQKGNGGKEFVRGSSCCTGILIRIPRFCLSSADENEQAGAGSGAGYG
jgi:hypothetical protein